MKKALVGFGGHAQEVLFQMGGVKLKCFVDDEYVVDGTLPLSKFDPTEYAIMVAVGDSVKRQEIVEKLPSETKYFTFIHPTAIVCDSIEIGEGSFIGANSILTTNIKIGKHCLLNRANHIGHDCRIGNYFSAMPGAIVSGNVTIKDCVYLGTNASIKEKLTITSNVTVGMNTGIAKSILEPGTYFRSAYLAKK